MTTHHEAHIYQEKARQNGKEHQEAQGCNHEMVALEVPTCVMLAIEIGSKMHGIKPHEFVAMALTDHAKLVSLIDQISILEQIEKLI